MADQLSTRYQDLLDGTYDCVDRIVLNAYFRPGHSGGGFRVWWQRVTGSDATLDNAHLMRLAGRFSRRARASAKAHGIPVIDCSVDDRKHEIAEQHLATTTVTEGLFLILVGRAQAPVWDVSGTHHLERKRPMPYVNHYSFHILDRDWGHLTIKISGHPPFPAQMIFNGHEYVACQARTAGIQLTKEGNCFTHISDPAGLVRRCARSSDRGVATAGKALDWHTSNVRSRKTNKLTSCSTRAIASLYFSGSSQPVRARRTRFLQRHPRARDQATRPVRGGAYGPDSVTS